MAALLLNNYRTRLSSLHRVCVCSRAHIKIMKTLCHFRLKGRQLLYNKAQPLPLPRIKLYPIIIIMNSAPNTTPNIIPTESHSGYRGREVQLTYVGHTRDGRIILRFSMGNEEYMECLLTRSHWELVREVGDTIPVMVAKYSIEQNGPIHMFWKFPVPIDAEEDHYRYYTYRHDTHTADTRSEVAETLGADIMHFTTGTFTGHHSHRRWL